MGDIHETFFCNFSYFVLIPSLEIIGEDLIFAFLLLAGIYMKIISLRIKSVLQHIWPDCKASPVYELAKTVCPASTIAFSSCV